MSELLKMLTYRRPAGSKTERAFIERYLDSIHGMTADAYGNRILTIPGGQTVFSCHTDTVHRKAGKQKIMIDDNDGTIFSDGSCVLGADDGTGVYIMRALIAEGVPGLYLFHRDEEIGGLGSRYIANETPHILDGYERCIAFDRSGTDSVITHQGFDRTCSDTFAEALSTALDFMPDDTGTFTDSANYTALIPECTNLSVGYEKAHTKKETTNLDFADWLIGELVALDFDGLPTARDPGALDIETDWWSDTGRAMDLDTALAYGDYDAVRDAVRDSPEDAAAMLVYLYDESAKRYA